MRSSFSLTCFGSLFKSPKAPNTFSLISAILLTSPIFSATFLLRRLLPSWFQTTTTWDLNVFCLIQIFAKKQPSVDSHSPGKVNWTSVGKRWGFLFKWTKVFSFMNEMSSPVSILIGTSISLILMLIVQGLLLSWMTESNAKSSWSAAASWTFLHIHLKCPFLRHCL